MSALVLDEIPRLANNGEVYMIAGWRQWADAGSVSSELPKYWIDKLGARKIGEIRDDGFYLFQTPATQFMFRPRIKFEEGYRTAFTGPVNEVYWWTDGEKGLVIFVGDEPHIKAQAYAEAFFDIAEQLGVRRIVGLGGVYAIVPYDKERAFTTAYSHPHMKQELTDYAVGMSNYEGGVSMGSYMAHVAEQRNIEYFTLYSFVPMYDFSQLHNKAQPVQIEEDYQAWHDAMARVNHMFKLGLNLSELAARSVKQREEIAGVINALAEKHPQVPIKEYITKLTADFVETPFTKLDDVWQDALDDLLDD
jgi:predicted ATP-grasp superfamily ATP-dependent carboligase